MKKNNKILFLLHLPPPIHGSSMVGKLIKDSESINRSFETRYINLLISRSVHETGKTKISKVYRFIGSWFNLLFTLAKERPNLCYFALTTTGTAFYKDVTLICLLKLFGVKTVFHLHNKGIKNRESSKIDSLLYKFIFKNSSVILLSWYLYDDIKTFVFKEQVYICPNGVEDNIKKEEGSFITKTESIKILYLSNLIKSKGVYELIEACRILRDRGYKFSCDFVGGEGDISADDFQNKVVNSGVASIAKYIGKKYGDDKDEIYKSADIFVLPTRNDCFPLVLLEAMQYSLPIISTYEGGIPDIVENDETGFLLQHNDSIELADKLEILFKNESLRLQMGNAGRLKYENEFRLQTFETQLQVILQHVLLIG